MPARARFDFGNYGIDHTTREISMNESSSLRGGANRRYDRLIAFETYDGPTTGVVFLEGSTEGFVFRLLAWDERQQRRVFSLSEIDANEGRDVISAFQQLKRRTFQSGGYDHRTISEA